jgi:uncharacterized protein (TIGR03435 family)
MQGGNRSLNVLKLAPRLIFLACVATLGFAGSPPVEANLYKMEIRRVGSKAPSQLCRKLRSKSTHFAGCSVSLASQMFEFAFNVDRRRIFGPEWMATPKRYLVFFEFATASGCRTIRQPLFREIVTERLSLSVRRELRDTTVLALRDPSGASLANVSKARECSSYGPPGFGQPLGAGSPESIVGGPGFSGGTKEDAPLSPPMGSPPGSGPSLILKKAYRGCTVSDFTLSIAPSLGIEVVDETTISSRHDFAVTIPQGTSPPGKSRLEAVAKQLGDQLGLDARIETRKMEVVMIDGPEPPKQILHDAAGATVEVECPEPPAWMQNRSGP